jgi:hypothetical protein
MEFHENSSCDSRGVACGEQRETDGRTIWHVEVNSLFCARPYKTRKIYWNEGWKKNEWRKT